MDNVNSSEFIKTIAKIKPDVIINQSQQIIGKELLAIPKYGVINRHNSLLPRHRGRITPFWVLMNEDKMTGVSIHYITSELDKGDLIYQFSYPVNGRNFNEIVETNYRIAPLALLKALEIIENKKNFVYKTSGKGNYNSTPVFTDLVKFLKLKYG